MKTKIKELRLEHKYTQDCLALKIGANQAALSRIECGISIPDAELIVRLSNVFEVSTDYLLCLSDQRFTYSRSEIALRYMQNYQAHISLLQKLNPNQRTHLKHFLESMAAIY